MKHLPIYLMVAVALCMTASVTQAQTITVTVTPTTINEGEFATFTFTASSPNPSRPIPINYIFTGQAIFGIDYDLTGEIGRVVIPAGQSSATVTLHAFFDGNFDPTRTATLRIVEGRRYRAGLPRQSTVKIDDLQ